MATLPTLHHDPTLAAMNAAIEADGNKDAARPYLGMSSIGKPCQRAVWYEFRWATQRRIGAAGLRAIHDGFVNEDVTAARLRKIPGVHLWTEGEDGKQMGCEDHGGHFRGHLDGVIKGLLQAPKTPHVWENKAVNEKKFNALKKLIAELGEKQALREWDTTYYAQAQLYMHYQGLTRHYLTVNTPGGRDTVTCRTEYDQAIAHHYVERARSLILSEAPPVRLSDDPAHWQCRFCDHHAVCHAGVFPKPTCRSCAHVTPMINEQDREKSGWHCRRWDDFIPESTQWAGCEQHLYHPEMLHSLEPANGNMSENWIQFKNKKTGETWTNGTTTGGFPSSALYQMSLKKREDKAAEECTDREEQEHDQEILSQLSAASGVPETTLMSGDMSVNHWAKVREGVAEFDERWQKQPRNIAKLKALIDVLDIVFYKKRVS